MPHKKRKKVAGRLQEEAKKLQAKDKAFTKKTGKVPQSFGGGQSQVENTPADTARLKKIDEARDKSPSGAFMGEGETRKSVAERNAKIDEQQKDITKSALGQLENEVRDDTGLKSAEREIAEQEKLGGVLGAFDALPGFKVEEGKGLFSGDVLTWRNLAVAVGYGAVIGGAIIGGMAIGARIGLSTMSARTTTTIASKGVIGQVAKAGTGKVIGTSVTRKGALETGKVLSTTTRFGAPQVNTKIGGKIVNYSLKLAKGATSPRMVLNLLMGGAFVGYFWGPDTKSDAALSYSIAQNRAAELETPEGDALVVEIDQALMEAEQIAAGNPANFPKTAREKFNAAKINSRINLTKIQNRSPTQTFNDDFNLESAN